MVARTCRRSPPLEGGAVLSATIDRYAWGTLRPRRDGGICINSLDFGTSLAYSSRRDVVLDGEMDLVKAAIRKLTGVYDQGFDLYLHCDAPPGTGLGSQLRDDGRAGGPAQGVEAPVRSPTTRSRSWPTRSSGWTWASRAACRTSTRRRSGASTTSSSGRDRVVVNGLRLGRDILNELEYNLLLVDTGKVRLSSRIIEDQVGRYERGEADSIAALREIKRLAAEMKDCLLRREWARFGGLLHEEWQHKKRMSRPHQLARARRAVRDRPRRRAPSAARSRAPAAAATCSCSAGSTASTRSPMRCAPRAASRARSRSTKDGLQTWRVA